MSDPVVTGDPALTGDRVLGGRCTFKDLCIDVTDQRLMAPFWASALGLTAEAHDNGAFRLGDTVPEHTVWINPVPEPRTTKQRVHLDLIVPEVGELHELGARTAADLPGWSVLTDPEGGELCAFSRPRDQLTTYRLLEIVVDSVDPAAIAAWWSERLGVTPNVSDDGAYWWLEPGSGLPVDWGFSAVPEPKRVKNRIHWDVLGDSAGLVEAGATLVRPSDGERRWDVLADPEGNEFCVFRPE